MTSEWFCRIMGEQWGPMSFEELVSVAHWGCLARDAFVQQGRDGAWLDPRCVPGLLSAASKLATAAAKPQAGSRSGSPAKRSVHNGMETKYWFRMGKKIAGPFSARQLGQLAEHGMLRRNHLVSRDKRNWMPASCLRDLDFPSVECAAETKSIRSAVEFDSPLEWSDSPTLRAAECEAADAVGANL